MVDPAKTLIGDLEREVSALPGAALYPGAGSDASARFLAAMGRKAPSGFAAFLSAHDGGVLGPDIKILTLAESTQRRAESERDAGRSSTAWPVGLWPIMERAGRRFALDAEEASTDGEWPVVEVSERGVDRVGTSFLRFLHVLAAELAAAARPDADALALANQRCRRDPGLAEHWLTLADLQEHAGRLDEIDATLTAALRAAQPPTPALLLTLGMRAVRHEDWTAATRAFEDAIALEPLAARDDDARLDAAALVYVLASERGDAVAMASARRVLGAAASATAAFWRAEALQALAAEPPAAAQAAATVDLALRIVSALVPEDTDVVKLRQPTPALLSGLRSLQRARESLEAGRPEQAVREARSAVGAGPVAELGAAHALLAEALNATRDRGALEAARRATELNPLLVEGWRELGDAHLEASDLKGAESAFRKVVEMDATYGLGYAKLAQVLLEQGRSLEALESITSAADRGGDPFFLAAIRGDIYAEMERHSEAAESYDHALRVEPDDHWALHQAAVEHGYAGHTARAAELFEAALKNDRDGCHQTLVDYGDHLRRIGRIGDAVKLYRRAVAAVPGDPEWKQTLREAERELLAAPN
ncbi:MAG TPA: tetratricopeptide repeat protein [Polyangia bacterium]|jgi:tetratricopeptide (TPR) repeat protein|nr:tetratricopeptide repeat protein [Polyangia bacterium]